MTDRFAADARRRPRNPHGEGGRLRDDLVRAASRLLTESADDGTVSLRAVARDVGIAAPSVYLHFPTRDALLRAVVDAHFAELKQAIEAATAAATGSAAKLRAGCLAYCRLAVEEPGAYRLLFSPSHAADGRVIAHLTQDLAGLDAFGTLATGIGDCIRDGVVPPVDPLVAATDVWTALHGMVTLRRSLPLFPWPPLPQQLDHFLLGLLGLPPAPPEGAVDPAQPGSTAEGRTVPRSP